jgi:acyl-CoA synthetase (AMP-forming)/AMP-acid ligase II
MSSPRPLAGRIAAGPDPVLAAQDGRRATRGGLAATVPDPAAAGRLGRTVLLSCRDPLDFVRGLVALDGRVDAVLLVSQALPAADLATLAAQAGVTGVLSDRDDIAAVLPAGIPVLAPAAALACAAADTPAQTSATRWLMTTSGTTGLPKIVSQDLAALAHRIRPAPEGRDPPLWGLVIDPTRFSGLLMVLQALIGGGRLILADTALPLAAQVAFLAAAGVTHLSGAPTLWRRLLMLPGRAALALRQITLVGEIADDPTLAALAAAWPGARIIHIYGSTEAGQGFSVADGRAGFPAAWLDAGPGGLTLAVRDGVLWVRPPPGARRPPSATGPVTVDDSGFVLTGDRVETRGDRVLFLGRDGGVINVGGVKIWPEVVEAVIRGVPGVGLVQVSARRSAMAGALVEAQVVAVPGHPAAADQGTLRAAILAACRAALPREAVPAFLRFPADLASNAAGKLWRPAPS